MVRGGRVDRMSRMFCAHNFADIARKGHTDHYESECERQQASRHRWSVYRIAVAAVAIMSEELLNSSSGPGGSDLSRRTNCASTISSRFCDCPNLPSLDTCLNCQLCFTYADGFAWNLTLHPSAQK